MGMMDKIFHEKALNQRRIQILDVAIKDLFPKYGYWHRECYQKSKALHYNNLPCHLRNHVWLSKFLQRTLSQKGVRISSSTIKQYLDNSTEFAVLRHEYELAIVKWQINSIMNGGGNWLLPDGFKKAPITKEQPFHDFDALIKLNAPDIDKMVRGGVVKTLRAIGMNSVVIEEGLEKYAADWRESCLLRGYQAFFYPDDSLTEENVDKNHRAIWLAKREYGYYQTNRQAVDQYGTPTPAMKMTPAEYDQLLDVLWQGDSTQMAAFVRSSKFMQVRQAQTNVDIKKVGALIDQFFQETSTTNPVKILPDANSVTDRKLSKLNIVTKASDLLTQVNDQVEVATMRSSRSL